LLFVARRLREQRVPFTLRFVGNGSWATRYREMTAELRLEGHIEFLGECNGEALVELFQDSDLAVLSSRHEGFCLSLAEAMGAGLPAVAFDCGGIVSEYLRDGINGFLAPFGDITAMAERIAWFQANPPQWELFSAAARATISEGYNLDLF